MDANAASVAIVSDGRVLLIKRAREPLAGLWTLPGGRCEPGETADEAAIREVREEVGLLVTSLSPLTQLAAGRWQLQVFVAGGWSGEIMPSDEVADWRWARVGEPLDTTPGLYDVLRLIPALA